MAERATNIQKMGCSTQEAYISARAWSFGAALGERSAFAAEFDAVLPMGLEDNCTSGWRTGLTIHAKWHCKDNKVGHRRAFL